MPILSRFFDRPPALEKAEIISKAIEIAQKPQSINELPPAHRKEIEPLVKAIQLGSGYKPPRTVGQMQQQATRPVSATALAVRAHQALGPSSSITPPDIALALAEQGMDWVEPFAPGTPLTPYYGYGRRPRNFDFRVGRNVSTETRDDRIPYETLLRLWKSYDIAQDCTRYSQNDLYSMRVRFEAAEGWEENPVKEIQEAKRFLKKPDGKYPFKTWLKMNQRNLWIFDSAPIYRDRNKAGKLKHLKNISAMTIAPMLDYYGDFPEAPAPAFQQFIEGVPWGWHTWDDLIYVPFWPETDSPYGTPPLETCLVNANTDIRLQLYFLQFFTAGTVPEAFAIAPEGMTSPDDLGDFQEWYDSENYGDQSDRWGLKWLPNGTELEFYKPQDFNADLAEYVERRTIAAFGLTPQNLGILQDVNRASSDTQMDQQFRVSTLPIVHYYEDLLDSVLQDDLSLPVQIRFDTGREKEDRLMEAQAHYYYVQMGAESVDEVREKVLGYAVNPEEKVPRFWDSQRLGPVPLEWIMSVSGDIDPLTGAPRPGTVQRREFVMVGQEQPDPLSSPSSSQYDKAKQNDASRGKVVRPKDRGVPVTASREKVYQRVGRPASKESSEEPSPQTEDEVGYGGFGYAVHGSSAQGSGSMGKPMSPEELEDLRRWRASARKAVANGKSPRPFLNSAISPPAYERVWAELQHARTRARVDAAFAKARGPEAAGILVQAEDTGRVLMTQRTPDKHDDDEAYARWEFPGGCLDPGETPWQAAFREFEEETGAELDNFTHVGNWTSPDGVYVGFVVTVPHEAQLELDPDPHETSAAEWWDQDQLDAPEVREKVTDDLDRVVPLLKGWEDYHRHTDTVIEHYAPQIEAAMSKVLRPTDISKALELAYGTETDDLEKAAGQNRSSRQSTPPGAGAGPGAVAGTGVPAGLPAAAAGGAASAGAGLGASLAGGAAAGGVSVGGALHAIGTSAGIAAAIALLAAARRNLDPIRKALAGLYGDAFLQGAHEAAQAADGEMPPWTASIETPASYWTNWMPGPGETAVEHAGPELSQLLNERDIWIKGMTDTQVDRVGHAVQESVENGRPLSESRAAIDEILHDTDRAKLIAETEYARASTVARRATYRANSVPMIEWLHQPDACPACMENAAVSPIQAGGNWPSGDVPVHPHCRCVEAPYYPRSR